MFSKLVFLNFGFNRILFSAVATNIMLATGSAGAHLDSVDTIRITEAANKVRWINVRKIYKLTTARRINYIKLDWISENIISDLML